MRSSITSAAVHTSRVYRLIFETATRVFCAKGFHAARIPDIAKEAGVASGSIYTYFASKKALCNQVYIYWRQRLYERISAEFPRKVDFREKFQLIWDRLADFARQYPEAFAFLENHQHSSYLDDEARKWDQRMLQFVEEVIDEGCRSGFLKRMPKLVMMSMIYGSLLEMFRRWRSGSMEFDEKNLAQASECLWQAISLRWAVQGRALPSA